MAEKRKAFWDLPGSRWNVVIAAVNGKIPKEKAGLEGEREEKLYDELVAEANAYEKRGGVRPIFEPVEIESDDPALDIYNNPV